MFFLLGFCSCRKSNADAMSVSTHKKPNSRISRGVKTIASFSDSFSKDGVLRRDLMFLGLSSSVALIFPALGEYSVKK